MNTNPLIAACTGPDRATIFAVTGSVYQTLCKRKEEEEKHKMKNDNKSFWAQPLKPWGACLTD